MLPDVYEAGFRESLKTRNYSERTIKTYKSMFRRLARDLDETDVYNEATLLQYRVQMRSGSVGIFDALWGILRQAEIGKLLPSAPRKPLVVYPHPLFADVMLLGAVYGNERLPDMTWGHVDGDFRFGETEKQAAIRCLTWASGLDITKPAPQTPLLPKDQRFSPMQLWQVEYIINSPELFGRSLKKYAKEGICELIVGFVTEVMRLNAPAGVLRDCCDRARQVGDRIGEVDTKAFLGALKQATETDDLTTLALALPTDPTDDTPPMW